MISGTTSIPFYLEEQKPAKRLQSRSCIDNKRAYFIIKRIFDFLISLWVIVFVLSWLSAIVALLIITDSKGPVFFIQRRVGRTGKSFPCFKFRTMIINGEADIKRADSNDARITRIGKILRRYNIDEFPQFFNVLLGHMSIVGPRPHMHSDCYEFSQAIPGYKFRTFVKPGITGMAQAKGFHGPVADPLLIEKRFEWDAYYVKNASIELDVRIIRATALQRLKLLFAA